MKAMNFFLLTVVMLVGLPAVAQQKPEQQQLNYLTELEKSRKMKNAGATLTVVGSVSMILGGAIVTGATGSGSWQPGIVLFVAGLGGVCSGIPVMAVGARNERKFQEKGQGLTVRISSTTHVSGLTLSYRF